MDESQDVEMMLMTTEQCVISHYSCRYRYHRRIGCKNCIIGWCFHPQVHFNWFADTFGILD